MTNINIKPPVSGIITVVLLPMHAYKSAHNTFHLHPLWHIPPPGFLIIFALHLHRAGVQITAKVHSDMSGLIIFDGVPKQNILFKQCSSSDSSYNFSTDFFLEEQEKDNYVEKN